MVNSDMSATLKAEIKEARKKGSSLKVPVYPVLGVREARRAGL